MTKLLVLCFIFLVIIATLLFGIAIMLDSCLKTIRNQLFKILDNVRPIQDRINDVWSTILQVRDNTTNIEGFLDKDEEESEEDADISSTDGWSTAPCPVCGGPAYMDYSLPAGDGYCVMCGKNANAHGHCDYGLVAGGKTRKTAAFEWNKAVVVYCNKKMQMEMEAGEDAKEVKA